MPLVWTEFFLEIFLDFVGVEEKHRRTQFNGLFYYGFTDSSLAKLYIVITEMSSSTVIRYFCHIAQPWMKFNPFPTQHVRNTVDENMYTGALRKLSTSSSSSSSSSNTLTPGSRLSGGVGDTASPSGRTHSCGDIVGDSSMKGMVSEPSCDFLSSAPSPS